MREKNEWEEFFDQHAPVYLENVFTKNTLAEVDFLIEELNLPKGSSILDVGCGTGRHSIELARRGYQMTGIDLSSGMLAEAKKNAAKFGVEVEWIKSNAVHFELKRLFDAALCLCEGAFGLLGSADDPVEHQLAILRNINRELKPKAKTIFTVMNGLALIRKYTPKDVEEGKFDPKMMVETYPMEYDTAEGKKSLMVRERGFVPPELVLMFRQTGFETENIWGGTAGNWGRRKIDLDEMEIMVVARKREDMD